MAKALCDRCGFTHTTETLQEEWTGLMVCDPCFETRHPQDFVRGVPDGKPPKFVRNYPTVVDVGVALNPSTQTTIPSGNFTTNNGTP